MLGTQFHCVDRLTPFFLSHCFHTLTLSGYEEKKGKKKKGKANEEKKRKERRRKRGKQKYKK